MTNTVVLEYRGNTVMDTGYFYVPYIPLTRTPVVLEPATFEPRQGILTRYGRRLLDEGRQFYGHLTLDDWGRPSDQPRRPLPKIDWRKAGF